MPEPAFERIRLERDGRVAVLVLDRPERRNALDARLLAELRTALARCDEDHDAGAILLRGEGPDFCAGADLEELNDVARNADEQANTADARAFASLFSAMRGSRLPIVAAVHGHVLAGGAGLASAADLIVAREDAVFGYPEVHIGFVPAIVTVLLRRALGEKKVFELIALGERFDAADALRIGLVARVFPRDSFEADCRAFARDLAARSASALELAKRLMYGIDALDFERAADLAVRVNVAARSTPDFRDGIRRFLQRRRP